MDTLHTRSRFSSGRNLALVPLTSWHSLQPWWEAPIWRSSLWRPCPAQKAHSPQGTKGCSVYLHVGPKLLNVLRNLVLNSEHFCDFIFSLFIQEGLHNMCWCKAEALPTQGMISLTPKVFSEHRKPVHSEADTSWWHFDEIKAIQALPSQVFVLTRNFKCNWRYNYEI